MLNISLANCKAEPVFRLERASALESRWAVLNYTMRVGQIDDPSIYKFDCASMPRCASLSSEPAQLIEARRWQQPQQQRNKAYLFFPLTNTTMSVKMKADNISGLFSLEISDGWLTLLTPVTGRTKPRGEIERIRSSAMNERHGAKRF